MRTSFLITIFGLASAAMIAAPVGSSPVLGLVSSRASFALSRVETRPEAGPLPVVDGDEVTAGAAPVLFRLSGPNRVVLGGSSHARIRPIHDSGRYFYLSKGSLAVAVAGVLLLWRRLNQAWPSGARRAELPLACALSLLAGLGHSLVDFNLSIPACALAFSWVAGMTAGLRFSPPVPTHRPLALTREVLDQFRR